MSQPPKTMSLRSASGTNSLIFGARASVRLPRRMVPIWVREPIGEASPLRMAITPAIVVVATAPSPTSSTPSLPRAGAIWSGEVTIGHYIMLKTHVFPAQDQTRHRAAVDQNERDSHGRTAPADWHRRSETPLGDGAEDRLE